MFKSIGETGLALRIRKMIKINWFGAGFIAGYLFELALTMVLVFTHIQQTQLQSNLSYYVPPVMLWVLLLLFRRDKQRISLMLGITVGYAFFYFLGWAAWNL